MPATRVGAVIWDMDGVIADTAPLHFAAWQEVFGKRGRDFTPEEFRHGFGLRNDAIIARFLGDGIAPEERDAISSEKERGFRRRLGSKIKPLPGVVELMRSLAGRGFKMSLASSAPRENIQLLVKALGIGGFLQVVVSGDEVSQGKPSPDTFLMAAEKLGVGPEGCIVIEDAVAGVEAAKRAGMKCLAVTNTHPKEGLAAADLVVDTLSGIDAITLERLIGLGG